MNDVNSFVERGGIRLDRDHASTVEHHRRRRFGNPDPYPFDGF